MAYKTRPRLTQAERNEMQMDLLQAYHYQLMNDQELYQFKSYRSIFSVLNMYLAGAIPMSLAYTLRPGAFEHLSKRVIRAGWISMGTVGVVALSIGYH